jgi:hypothetical protein
LTPILPGAIVAQGDGGFMAVACSIKWIGNIKEEYEKNCYPYRGVIFGPCFFGRRFVLFRPKPERVCFGI